MTSSRDLWCKFRHKAAASVVLLFGLAILVVAWFFLPDLAGAGRSIPCAEPTETPSASPSATVSPAPPTAPVPLILEKPEGVVIDFGKDRGAHLRTVYLQVAKKTRPKGGVQFAKLIPESDVGVSERPLERQELEGHIGPKEYVATATVTDRKEVSLTICVDTSELQLDPGTYEGSVRLSGGDIQAVTVPVSVTLQYAGYRWIVPLLGVVTFLAGSFVVWASHKRASNTPEQTSIWRSINQLPGWIMGNYVGVAGGMIAMTSVFIARYWRTPAWGARAPEDWFALLGAMFTAFTTTLTAATAIVTPHPSAPKTSEVVEGADTSGSAASTGTR